MIKKFISCFGGIKSKKEKKNLILSASWFFLDLSSFFFFFYNQEGPNWQFTNDLFIIFFRKYDILKFVKIKYYTHINITFWCLKMRYTKFCDINTKRKPFKTKSR